MTGDRHDAVGPARRIRREKMTARWGRNALWAAMGGFLLMVAVCSLIALTDDPGGGRPCPPAKVCGFVR
ncbi:hypothetical protein ACGFX4_15990 [Kitasatospora sp. NPDC048365]|uniref:hypothetical protein n=1 Tax=Kitasatospora sp. NPDC048365 TaxID=3364050 RepID=UPI003717AE46